MIKRLETELDVFLSLPAKIYQVTKLHNPSLLPPPHSYQLPIRVNIYYKSAKSSNILHNLEICPFSLSQANGVHGPQYGNHWHQHLGYSLNVQ